MRAAIRLVALSASIPLGLSLAPAPPAAASAGSSLPIAGSGSSFAAVAIDVWAQSVRPKGLVVNYNPDGSDAGRADYIASQDDYAVSDEPFRTSADKLAGLGPEHVPLGFSYIPAPASGVAFPYHLTVGGHQVSNLRLSGSTVMKIFTGQITNWDDERDPGHRPAQGKVCCRDCRVFTGQATLVSITLRRHKARAGGQPAAMPLSSRPVPTLMWLVRSE